MSENTLKRAAQILSGACDGARSIDGSGFNKFDTAKGLQLANLPDSDWNEVVNAQAYTMLAKYRKQLQKAGFDFAQVAKPDLTLGKVNTEFVTAEGGNFHVFFKNFKVLDAVRALPRRRFESGMTPKRWVVPATVEAVEAVAAMAEKSGFEIRESALDLMSEVYSEEETEAQVKHADSVIESVEAKKVSFDGKIQIGKTRVVVTFNAIPDVLIRAWMKEVKDWKYSDTKWSFPVSESLKVAQQFRNHEGAAEVIAEAERLYQERLAEIEKRKREKIETSKRLLSSIDLDAIRVNGNPLYAHQKEDVRTLLTEHNMIVANQMGTGKSATALTAAKAWQQTFGYPVIVIGPVSLRDNWIREAGYVEVVIEYYSWAKQPEEFDRPFVLIGDEAHAIQNLKSKRTKAFVSLAKSVNCKAVIPMTGTPMKNGQPINMYPLLLAVGAEVAEDKAYYQKRYCAGGVDRWGRYSVTGASHLDELHQKCKPVMLRRTKAQCLDLPAKIRTKVPVTLSKDAQEIYNTTFDNLRKDYFARLEEAAKKRAEYASLYTEKKIDQAEYEDLCSELMSEEGEQLVLLTHLRNAGSIAKVESAIEMAEDLLDEGSPVIVFTEFVESAKLIAKKLTAYGVELLTGEVTGKDKETGDSKRQAMVDRFQAGKSKVFVSTFKAGGVGITLTAASDVILVDRPWTPGDTEQGEDRAHRIGQKSTVNCQWLQYGKMDAKIDAILEDKTKRIDLVLEGERKTMRGTGNMAQELRNIFNEIVNG